MAASSLRWRIPTFAFACNTHNERAVAAQCQCHLHSSRQARRSCSAATARDISLAAGPASMMCASPRASLSLRNSAGIRYHRRHVAAGAGPEGHRKEETIWGNADGFDQLKKAAAAIGRDGRDMSAPPATRSRRCRPNASSGRWRMPMTTSPITIGMVEEGAGAEPPHQHAEDADPGECAYSGP